MSRASFWSVGVDDDRESVWTFENEDEAMRFAHFDSQLEDACAVVLRWNLDGPSTVVAEFVR